METQIEARIHAGRVCGNGRKRKFNMEALRRANNAMKSVGRASDTDLHFYAYVASVGYEREIKSKKGSKKTFSFTKQTIYIITGSLQDIDLNNPVVTEIVPPKYRLRLDGIWDNGALRSFEEEKARNPEFSIPKTTSCLYLEEGKMYSISGRAASVKAGNVIKLIGVRVSSSRNTTLEALEKYGPDSGWFQYNNFILARPLTFTEQISMFERAGLYTTFVKPYTIGQVRSFQEPIQSFIFSMGPTGSYFEDPGSGYSFQLDIDYENVSFRVPASKEDKAKAAIARGKPEEVDSIKVYQMGLSFSVGGKQGYPSKEQIFLLETMIFPMEKISDESTKLRPGCLYNFGILSKGIWGAIMPSYFHMMDLTVVCNVDWKRTSEFAGQLAAASGNVDAYHEDTGVYADWRLGGEEQGSTGVSAAEASAFLDMEEEEEGTQQEHDGTVENVSSKDDFSGEDDSAEPIKFDFAYNINVKNIIFDAKAFWKKYAIRVTPKMALTLWVWFCGTKGVEAVHKSDSEAIPFENFSKGDANDVFRTTDILCTTCMFVGAKNLLAIDEDGTPKLKNIDSYYIAVPWKGLTEDYAAHIAALSPEQGDELVAKFYNMGKFFKSQKDPDLEDASMLHAKALYDLEGGEPFIEKSSDRYAFVPAVFAAWKDSEGRYTDKYVEETNNIIDKMVGGSVAVITSNDSDTPIQESDCVKDSADCVDAVAKVSSNADRTPDDNEEILDKGETASDDRVSQAKKRKKKRRSKHKPVFDDQEE